MVQPIDYATLAGGFQSPQEAFTNTIKLREYYLQQQKAAEEARLAKEKAVQMEADLKDYTTNPDPQKLASLHLRYPVLKQGLDSYTQTLSDADKRTTTDFATQAFGLNRAGKTEDVLSLFDRYIVGAEKRPAMVRTFKDAKEAYLKIEDPKAREALIGSVLASTGKEGLDLYDKIWNAQDEIELTSFQKDLEAGGIPRNSPEGIEKARQYAELKIDPIVEMETPSGGKFVGRESAYFNLYGGGAEKPQIKAVPKVGEVRNGYKFTGGDPADKSNWVKSEGGQTGAPSGGFR
jgi:hypothetical protein